MALSLILSGISAGAGALASLIPNETKYKMETHWIPGDSNSNRISGLKGASTIQTPYTEVTTPGIKKVLSGVSALAGVGSSFSKMLGGGGIGGNIGSNLAPEQITDTGLKSMPDMMNLTDEQEANDIPFDTKSVVQQMMTNTGLAINDLQSNRKSSFTQYLR